MLVRRPLAILDMSDGADEVPARLDLIEVGMFKCRDETMWIDQLHDVLEACLRGSHAGLLSVPGIPDVAPLPVHYQSRQLAVTCLIPRWSDLAEALHHQPIALLIIPAAPDPERWLQYQGRSRLVSAAAWGSMLPGGLSRKRSRRRSMPRC